jgi:hypothetical protein
VFAGLGHWAVSGGTHQMAPSCAAPVIMFSHSRRGLGSPRGRSGGRLVLNVGGVDGDTASLSAASIWS